MEQKQVWIKSIKQICFTCQTYYAVILKNKPILMDWIEEKKKRNNDQITFSQLETYAVIILL